MPPNENPIPIRETSEYKEIQHDQRFQGWLLMQDAAMEIEFVVFDVPELNGHLYTREGLVVAEREMLKRFESFRDMFSESNVKLGMRFVYFVGETFRRQVEGKWVALPPDPARNQRAQTVIEASFLTSFYNPRHMISFALERRTGTQISWIFDHAVEDHRKWVEAGRPPAGSLT